MTTYQDKANQTSSEKVVLCTAESAQLAKIFTLHSGSVYYKDVDFFVSKVKQDNSDYTQGTSTSLSTSQFYFNPLIKRLYIRTSDSSNPKTKNITIFYKHFFSSVPLNLANDLSTGEVVEWEARIGSTPSIKQSLDNENTGIAVESNTSVSLINRDRYFDAIYDKHIFENKEIKIYSWFIGTNISEHKKIFDGVIESKSFSADSIQFKAKDFTFRLREFINLNPFTSADGTMSDSFLGTPKRRIYGRVKQAKCVPIDNILSGYTTSRTVSGNVDETTITFSASMYGSLFQGDEVIINLGDGSTLKVSIESPSSSTVWNIGSKLTTSFAASTLIINPPNGHRSKNRNWHIAGHKLYQPTSTISSVVSGRRFTLSGIEKDEILSNDTIEVGGDYATILRSSGNSITTLTNISPVPSVSNTVTKQPINNVFYHSNELVINRDYSFTNTTEAILNINSLAEFNVAPIRSVGVNLTFTNGSRSVTSSGSFDLRTIINPRDWIRSTRITDTTWYEVTYVAEQSIAIVNAFSGTSGAIASEYKNIDMIKDESIVTVSCYGLQSGTSWIKTPAQSVKHLLENDIGFVNIDTTSFTKSDSQCDYTVSLIIPDDIGGSIPNIRDVISKINSSVFGSLYTTSSFNLGYSVLNSSKPVSMSVLKDDDIVDFSISTNNNIIKKCIVNYRPFVDVFNGSASFDKEEYSSDFVANVVEDLRTKEVTLYLYHQEEAQTMAQRIVFFNSLCTSIVKIKTKMNLSLVNLNDQLYIEFDRLFTRYGATSKKKIGVVTAITKNGYECEIEFNDLSIYNRVPSYAPDTTNVFTSASDDEKIRYGFYVDSDTLTPDITSEEMLGLNLLG